MPDLLVWGAGGHGRVVADVARSIGYDVAGYSDADESLFGTPIDLLDARLVVHESGLNEWINQRPGHSVGLGVGANQVRLARSLSIPDHRIPPLVHATAILGSGVRLAPGCVVMAGAVINSCASIGRAAIINTLAIVEHDSAVGNGAHVSPGAVITGAAVLGECAWVGASATVLPGLQIGAHAVVGAGAVVLHEVPIGATVVGSPAQRIR